MLNYNPSQLVDNVTLLEQFHAIQEYLKAHPLYQVYGSKSNFVDGTLSYPISILTIPTGAKLGVGDVVVFENAYYGIVTDVNETTFTIETGISTAGAKGLDALVYNSLWNTTYPAEVGRILYLRKADFNRPPIVGDYMVLYFSTSQYALCRITDITSAINFAYAIVEEVVDTKGATGGGGIDSITSLNMQYGDEVTTFDTTDGITVSSNGAIEYTDGEETKTQTFTTEMNVPIIPGDGITMDMDSENKKVVVNGLKQYTYVISSLSDFNRDLSSKIARVINQSKGQCFVVFKSIENDNVSIDDTDMRFNIESIQGGVRGYMLLSYKRYSPSTISGELGDITKIVTTYYSLFYMSATRSMQETVKTEDVLTGETSYSISDYTLSSDYAMIFVYYNDEALI